MGREVKPSKFLATVLKRRTQPCEWERALGAPDTQADPRRGGLSQTVSAPWVSAGQQDGCGSSDGTFGGDARHARLCGEPVWQPGCAPATHGVCPGGEY